MEVLANWNNWPLTSTPPAIVGNPLYWKLVGKTKHSQPGLPKTSVLRKKITTQEWPV